MCTYIYTHIRTHINTQNVIQPLKKNEISPFVTKWMDLEVIMLNEISHTKRQILHDFIYTWNQKNKTKQKQNQAMSGWG